MKKISRFIILALSISLVLSLAGISFAQDDLCLGLDEDDCELYHELAEDAEVPVSSAFAVSIDTDGSIEENGNDPEEFSASFDLSGAYVIDEEAVDAAWEEFGDVDVLDVSARSFLDLFRGTLEGFDAELELDYAFPQELGVPPIGPFNLWLVDGVGYVDFTPFSMFDPSLTGVNGINIFDLVEVPLQNVEMGDLLEGLEDAADFSMDDMLGTDMGDDTNPFESFMPANISEDDIASFATMERLDDETVDGVDVAVFVTTIDLAAAMQVDAIVSQAYQGALQSDLPEEISEEEFGEALAEALAGSVVTVTEKIDTETAINMQTIVEVNMILDIEPFAAAMGEQEEGSLTFNMTVDFSRSDVNAVDAIELPENAQEIPVEALLGGF